MAADRPDTDGEYNVVVIMRQRSQVFARVVGPFPTKSKAHNARTRIRAKINKMPKLPTFTLECISLEPFTPEEAFSHEY